MWLAPGSGAAAQQLIQLLATAQSDNLNPKRYNPRGLDRALNSARSGDPRAVQRAETMLSQAFVAYVRDLKRDPGGVVYVDQELRPSAPSANTILDCVTKGFQYGVFVHGGSDNRIEITSEDCDVPVKISPHFTTPSVMPHNPEPKVRKIGAAQRRQWLAKRGWARYRL